MSQASPLFTFAIITDTHIRPAVLDESSPFPVNDLANDRARYAIAEIDRHVPDFVLHLGDMVHTLPHLPTYPDACREAHEIFAPLRDRLKFMPGNHDIGDKPMPDSPAGPVTDQLVARFEDQFGPCYHHFEHAGCLFVMINASLVNSGTVREAEQRAWLEGLLAANAGRRTFLCSHYPPYINAPGEHSHYDNYAEPGRSWLLGLLETYRVEALFSGHVHQFFFNRRAGTSLYCLPPTSFIRQDYSELYRIDPPSEYGRNDTGKFSIALVDVFAEGHRLRVIPTDGQGLAREAAAPPPSGWSLVPATSLRLHLRHAWAETTALPYNGPMEEFSRKRARNDYTLLRLWQMGISRVRVPASDLIDPEPAMRMADYAATGIRFSVFTLGIPDAAAVAAIARHPGIVDQFEIVSATDDLSDIAGDLSRLAPLVGRPLLIGKSHSSKHEPERGTKFAHSVSYGFKWETRDAVLAALRRLREGHAGLAPGLVFQLNLTDSLADRLAEADAFAAAEGIRLAVNVRLADANPARANFDDAAIADRVAAAARLAEGLAHVEVQLDTFVDVDRGYNPRHGLLDRHYNFRPAGRSLAQQSFR